MVCLKGNLEICTAKYVVAIGEFYEIDLFALTSSVCGSRSFCYLAGLALNAQFERISDS